MISNILNYLDPIDLEILLCHILKVDRSFLRTHPETKLSTAQIDMFCKLAAKRLKHEPMAYITGNKYFFGLNFRVNHNVLVPRPETEILVEQALAILPDNSEANVLELGTGSGAVILAIAKYRPKCNFYATDISNKALVIAKKNANLLKINNIRFYKGDWFKAIPKLDFKFDIIISNPPYIGDEQIFLCDQEIFYEPKIALFTDNKGMYCLEHIIAESIYYLKKSGYLLLEHGYNQANEVANLLAFEGFTHIQYFKDLSNISRAIVAQKL